MRRLGGDLPGTVVIREEKAGEITAITPRPTATEDNPTLVKFSLAGVHMKFSMVATGDRLTLPARGESGRIIVKLPSREHPDLPEIEFGAMTLAKAAGVGTAEVRLVPLS